MHPSISLALDPNNDLVLPCRPLLPLPVNVLGSKLVPKRDLDALLIVVDPINYDPNPLLKAIFLADPVLVLTTPRIVPPHLLVVSLTAVVVPVCRRTLRTKALPPEPKSPLVLVVLPIEIFTSLTVLPPLRTHPPRVLTLLFRCP